MSLKEIKEIESVETAVELESGMVETKFASGNRLTLLSSETYHLKWITDRPEQEVESSLKDELGISVERKESGVTYHTQLPNYRIKTYERMDDRREVVARSSNPEDVLQA